MGTDQDNDTGLTELVTAAKGGDRDAFDALVRDTYRDTYTLAFRLLADPEDARDVVQETYLRAWKGLGRYRGDAQFTTWLYRITANTASTHRGRRGRQRATSIEEHELDFVDESRAGQPEAMGESALELASLGEALDLLPAKLRQAVVLKDVYDLPHDAIAAELGISVTAAKVRLHRGRKQLREILDDRGVHSRGGRNAV